MKSILVSLLTFVVVLGTPLAPTLPAQNTGQDKYSVGVRLFNEGRFIEALAYFEEVLRARPDFVYARSYAAKCKKAIAENAGPKNDLEGKLSRLVLEQINFSEAPLADVLDYFANRAQELTKGQLIVNFIYNGTAEQRSATLITLSLRNVPMSEAIKYVGQLSRSRIKYEPHAIVIDPGAAAESKPETPAPEPSKSTFE